MPIKKTTDKKSKNASRALPQAPNNAVYRNYVELHAPEIMQILPLLSRHTLMGFLNRRWHALVDSQDDQYEFHFQNPLRFSKPISFRWKTRFRALDESEKTEYSEINFKNPPSVSLIFFFAGCRKPSTSNPRINPRMLPRRSRGHHRMLHIATTWSFMRLKS